MARSEARGRGFASVLVANRGEIACRIFRACRAQGLRTVAVHSEVDADARHVALADERHSLGGRTARESYLDAERIVAAARAHGAEAIHPGYGFLAEKTDLPDLCARHGLVWIGPRRETIAAMGSKIEARKLAAAAGLAVLPGHDGRGQDAPELIRAARTIGYPLLIKPSAGGGGKGMRRVEREADFAASLDLARREAMAAFGDDAVLLEKCIRAPRHLEVQIAGDLYGNLVHFFERECSIQRQYQKLIEEAPAAHLAPPTRAALHAAALKLGHAIGYQSLGTVEFVLDAAGDGTPYFLEVNTRLQVEHPVTEAVTGIDLVELQLRLAAGEPVPFAQEEIRTAGHAIEARVAAEDPSQGFRPEIGRVVLYDEPRGPGLRIDSGIETGSRITPYYDSLLAKLIASGPDRASARRRLRDALAHYVILGLGTNAAFLRDLLDRPEFLEKPLTTDFIGRTFPAGWSRPAPPPAAFAAAAAAHLLIARQGTGEFAPEDAWRRLAGFRVQGGRAAQGAALIAVAAEDGRAEIATLTDGAKGFRVVIDGAAFEVTPEGETTFGIRSGEASLSLRYAVTDQGVEICAADTRHCFTVTDRLSSLAGTTKTTAAPGHIVATMPGLVTEIKVKVGQRVASQDPVVILEAMKLVVPLAAPADGIVRAIHCAAGRTVAGGETLVEIEPLEPDKAAAAG